MAAEGTKVEEETGAGEITMTSAFWCVHRTPCNTPALVRRHKTPTCDRTAVLVCCASAARSHAWCCGVHGVVTRVVVGACL